MLLGAAEPSASALRAAAAACFFSSLRARRSLTSRSRAIFDIVCCRLVAMGLLSRRGLLHESTEHAAVLCRDRVEPACVAVALVTRERELASADGEPSPHTFLHVDDEPNRSGIAGSCFRRLHVVELCFEASAQEPDGSAGRGIFMGSHRASNATAGALIPPLRSGASRSPEGASRAHWNRFLLDRLEGALLAALVADSMRLGRAPMR